jgi:L-alanine-DL-glutamate epimerase-like enolase superfamily enzyme
MIRLAAWAFALGAAISSIEIALRDIAGQAAGLPVHKLLSHDRLLRKLRKPHPVFPPTPQVYAELAAQVKEAKEGFKLVKFPVGFTTHP